MAASNAISDPGWTGTNLVAWTSQEVPPPPPPPAGRGGGEIVCVGVDASRCFWRSDPPLETKPGVSNWERLHSPQLCLLYQELEGGLLPL